MTFLFALFLPLLAQANDASFVGDGATVYANQENRVRMVREKIKITYDDKGANQRRWRADCEFQFENLTDQPVRLTMGFPNWSTFGDDVGKDRAIREFTTEIDGKSIMTEEKEISKDKLAAPWKAPGKMATFDAAIVWPVEFAPRAKLMVKNTFAFGGFSSNGPFDALDHMPPTYPKIKKQHRFWASRKPKNGEIDFANSLVGAVAYITTTGRTWKGPIEEAEISIEFPPFVKENPHFAIPLPEGARIDAERVSWRFKNYRPKEEVALYFISHPALPDDLSEEDWDAYKRGFEHHAQAQAWVKFVSKGQVAPEVVDRLIEISKDPGAKGVLRKFRQNQSPVARQTSSPKSNNIQ